MSPSSTKTDVRFGVWSEPLEGDSPIRRVRFTGDSGSGYIMEYEKGERAFDVWLETLDEVVSEVEQLGLTWKNPPP
jgi:hypothetical protein